jgi:hypothetical protein
MRGKLMIGFLAILLNCVACGGSDGDDGGGGSGGASSLPDACTLVTAEDATALFGEPALKETGSPTPDPNLSQCVWGYDYPDNSSHLLQMLVYANELAYSEPSGSTPFTIGEKGYLTVGSLGVDVGWVQKGMTLMLAHSTVGPMAGDATAKTEEVKTLAKKVEGKL